MTYQEWFFTHQTNGPIAEVVQSAWDAATAAERERCLAVIDLRSTLFGGEPLTDNEASIVRHIAAAIRKEKS